MWFCSLQLIGTLAKILWQTQSKKGSWLSIAFSSIKTLNLKKKDPTINC
jgi:hypothetical protein